MDPDIISGLNQIKRSNAILLLLCRAVLLSLPMANMFYMIAIALGIDGTVITGIICSVLTFFPIILYENLFSETLLLKIVVGK